MKDKSKKLTVVNTDTRKPAPSGESTTQVVGGGSFGGISIGGGLDYLLKAIWDKVWEIKTDSQGNEYIFGKLPVVTQYGITMYADGGELNLPSIYAGLPIDYSTLIRDDNGVLKINPDIDLGGGASTWDELIGKPTWIGSTKPSYNYSEILQTPDLSVYALASDLAKYVTLAGDETIKGLKNFTKGLQIDGLGITKSQDDVIYLDANLVVRGGITMFGTNSVDVPTIMDAIATDGVNLKVVDGVLTFVGSSGGGLSEVHWDDVKGRPTLLSSFIDDVGYLQKSGGQITGNIGYTLERDTTYTIGLPVSGSASFTDFYSFMQSSKTFIGSILNSSSGAWFDLISLRHTNGHGDDGTKYGLYIITKLRENDNLSWNKQINGTWQGERVILDSVNWSQYITAGQIGAYLPLSGGTLTGKLNVYNTVNAGQNINGTATIDAFNGMAYYGCDAVNNGQVISSTGAFIAIKGTTGYIAMGHNNPLYKLDVAASANQIVRVISVGNAEASIRYTNNSDKTWVAGIGCAGIGDGFGIYSYTYGQNALYCDNTGMTVIAQTTSIGDKGIAFNRNINQGGIFDSSKVGVQMHIEDGGLLVNHFDTSDKGVRVALFERGGFLSYGGITMYSDIRKKTKLQDVELSLNQIADAPLIEHYYNSDTNKTTHVGSIAQYWAGLNDWFCKLDSEGFYTMEIQNAALASAISVARELQRYESKTDRKIRLLKQRVKELEDKIEKLENN